MSGWLIAAIVVGVLAANLLALCLCVMAGRQDPVREIEDFDRRRLGL